MTILLNTIVTSPWSRSGNGLVTGRFMVLRSFVWGGLSAHASNQAVMPL